jgi:hypothetical protein
MNTNSPKKRPLHVTLRDLFWLMLVVAVACTWWVERRGANALERANSQALEREKELLRKQYIVEQQLGHVQLKLAQEGYAFHFDIFQYPDGTTDVRFIDESK